MALLHRHTFQSQFLEGARQTGKLLQGVSEKPPAIRRLAKPMDHHLRAAPAALEYVTAELARLLIAAEEACGNRIARAKLRHGE